MKITNVYAQPDFHLIIEFNHRELRTLDIKDFLKNDKSLLQEIRDDLNLFLTASIDEIAGVVFWAKDVDFDSAIVYEHSQKLDTKRLFQSTFR